MKLKNNQLFQAEHKNKHTETNHRLNFKKMLKMQNVPQICNRNGLVITHKQSSRCRRFSHKKGTEFNEKNKKLRGEIYASLNWL